METFGTILLIALLIVPAIWVASLLWSILVWLVVGIMMGVFKIITWVFGEKN